MNAPMRSVKLSSGHTLAVWDNETQASTGQNQLRYTMLAPRPSGHNDLCTCEGCTDRPVLFCGADYGVSPMHAIDSDAAILGLLGFLTLRPGDTGVDYFAEYTPAQMDFAESYACESLAADVSIAEEAGGCVCDYVWTNLDGWTCDAEDRGNVADFEVTDHGEDGSQYFPGASAAHTGFQHIRTGVGDTGAEALADALEQMAMDDVHPSKLQEIQMRDALRDPDTSASARIGPGDTDAGTLDWHHYVSIRYNVRED